MASEFVFVKEEIEIKVEAKNEFAAASEENEPEYENNQVKIDAPTPSNVRIKTDVVSRPRSPDSLLGCSWHVPIKEEVNPDNYVEINIKEEIHESEEDEPVSDDLGSEDQGYEDQVSDDSASKQDTTSEGNGINELYHQAPSGSFVCHICSKTFSSAGNVQRHLLIHTKNTIKCDQCDGQFTNQIRLDRHIFNRHTPPSERVYPCNDCSKTFKTSSNLMQHKKTHLTIKPYQCTTCFRTFSFKSNLKKHENRNRCKTPLGELKCEICNIVFEKEYSLISHLKKHDTQRPFSCEECDMSFKFKSTLMRHMHVHNGIRPYSCPHCGKTFTSSGLLKPHLRVHTGEKPYPCQLCDKKFTHKHNMQRHMLGHEKIKHTVCDICHKKFPRESRLKYHMRAHVNEKYFLCNVCPKRFSHKQNVLRHYTRKHPGQTYKCADTDASVATKIWDTFKKRLCDDDAEEILG